MAQFAHTMMIGAAMFCSGYGLGRYQPFWTFVGSAIAIASFIPIAFM